MAGVGRQIIAQLEGLLLDLVDHLLLPADFAIQLSGWDDPGEAAQALWSAGRELVAVTCGASGAWGVGRGAWWFGRAAPAFPVQVVDTTGCGDVFHGAYAAAFTRGLRAGDRMPVAFQCDQNSDSWLLATALA
jgi:sugar/nucleoside kinase (ribokinase family)